ncbi:MAG: TA system VapC family ribonuclease toxin [Steroidobacteraceae bacterium]
MIVPDANLLLYAYDSSSPFHDRSRNWWQACLSGREAVGLTHPVIFAFLRISTSARVYADPMTLAESASHIRSWLSRRVCQVLDAPGDHSDRVIGLLESAGGAAGNLVTDAQIGSLALSYHGVVHTADRDFLRFPTVRCRFPLDE